ncbi:MAG: anthranilate phosphoribosyltransferase [Thermoplasmata archaeon]
MIREAISEVVERHDLSTSVAHDVMLEMVRGEATPSQIAAFVTALRMKGETESEIRGFVTAMRELAVKIRAPEGAVDLCGTGGDGSGTFNISTTASFVAAAAGVPVAKHGNRSMSSRCGSADALAALGVPLDLEPARVERCLSEEGICFMFAPRFHESMRNVASTRREIGVRTFFNILGPMTNPADVKRQLIGVYDGSLAPKMARVLASLGSQHVMIAHGSGMDEITNTGDTQILEVRHGVQSRSVVSPEDFGFDRAEPHELQGGDPNCNARIMLSVLKGERSPRSDVVAMNAGAAIYVAGRAESIFEGVRTAEKVLRSGKALAKLKAFAETASNMEREAQLSSPPETLLGKRLSTGVLSARSAQLSSHLAARLAGSEDGKAALRHLNPELLSHPSPLSVIALGRLLSVVSGDLSIPGRAVEHEHISMARRIGSSEGIAVVAEYKPRSPTTPPLQVPPEPEIFAEACSRSSIAGLSVLVEPVYFSGSPDLFSFFRRKLRLPMLFKDFVVSEDQIALAEGLGADAVLLMAKTLQPDALDLLIRSCLRRGLEPLVEVHDEADIAALSSIDSFDDVKMVGINSRDFRTLRTDLGVFSSLSPLVPEGKLVVAESGISTAADIMTVSSADAVLVGSVLMRSEEPARELRSIVRACRSVSG